MSEERFVVGSVGDVDEVLAGLERFITSVLSVDEGLSMAKRVKSRSDSWMCRLADRQAASRPAEDTVEVVREKTGMSKRDAKELVDVSQGLKDLPGVGRQLAEGEITFGHARALSNAAGKIGADVIEADSDLLNRAGKEPVDVFTRRVGRWVNRQLVQAGVDPLRRQRQARSAKLWVEKDTGLGVVLAKLPADRYQHLRQAADTLYLQEYRRDKDESGGNPDHIRSPGQRMADVVYQLLTNRHPVTGEMLPTQNTGSKVDKAKASTQLVITAELGVIDGTKSDGACEIIGVGPVPRQYLQTLSPDTQIASMLYDRAGRILWLGRNQRLANIPQRLALAVKYGGCSLCTEPMNRCDIHHVREWHQDEGRTDIDNPHTVVPTTSPTVGDPTSLPTCPPHLATSKKMRQSVEETCSSGLTSVTRRDHVVYQPQAPGENQGF